MARIINSMRLNISRPDELFLNWNGQLYYFRVIDEDSTGYRITSERCPITYINKADLAKHHETDPVKKVTYRLTFGTT